MVIGEVASKNEWVGWLINPESPVEEPISKAYAVKASTPYEARKAVFQAYCREFDYKPKKTDSIKAQKAIRIRNLADGRNDGF